MPSAVLKSLAFLASRRWASMAVTRLTSTLICSAGARVRDALQRHLPGDFVIPVASVCIQRMRDAIGGDDS